ncbi:MAG: class I SAM-dependent methyltransferase [Proteobacteria bacterium]|nr:class I SAM-dependent methyltransferase [Pseudomonadota bacterium]
MSLLTYNIRYPQNPEKLDQNEEWITLVKNHKSEKIRLHEYDKFFSIPGLYEEVVYKELKCCSPITVCSNLKERISGFGGQTNGLRVLDFGAGNGMIGECLTKITHCEALVGLDIIDQARMAALRDYPGVYDEYYVMDMSQIDPNKAVQLKKWKFNVLITVAALGFGDIPTLAFMNAFNMIEKGGWIAFNIKERFVSENDESGFQKIIEYMTKGHMDFLTSQRYCHRLSLSGEPLYYHAVIGKKTNNIESPAQIVQKLQTIPN